MSGQFNVPPIRGNSGSSSSFNNSENSEPSGNENSNSEFSLNRNQNQDNDNGGVGQGQVQQQQEGVSGKQGEAKTGKAEGLGASAKATELTQVAKLLLKMVDKLQHGEGITKLELKETDKVPDAFKGTQITIDTNTSKIGFQNFKTEAAMNDAHKMMTQNPDELQQLANQLYDRGFRGAQIELNSGNLNLVVSLPKAIQAPQTPMQAASDQSSMEREGGGQQGGQQGRDQGDGSPSE